MEGAEHQVTGERSLDANLGGLAITDLSHHDNVGIGTQKRPHSRGKVKPNSGVDLHLPQPVLRDLDGVLSGPDLSLWGVNIPEGRVKGCGFSRTGGPDAENSPVGLLEEPLKLLQVSLRHGELVEGERLAGGLRPAARPPALAYET